MLGAWNGFRSAFFSAERRPAGAGLYKIPGLLMFAVLALVACETTGSNNLATAPLVSQAAKQRSGTDRLDSAVFAQAAAEVLATYNRNLRLAVRPMRVDETSLPESVRRRVELNLVSAMRQAGGPELVLVTRSELGRLLEDVDFQDAHSVANLELSRHADALLIPDALPVSEGLSLSLAIYDVRRSGLGRVLGSTSGHLVPLDLEVASTISATTAVRKTAVAFAHVLMMDSDLLNGDLRFASIDDQGGPGGGMSAWLSAMLASDLAEVVPGIRAGQWAPVGGGTPEVIVVQVGTETWDHGDQVQVRFRLRRDGRPVLAERSARITSESIPFGVRSGGAGLGAARHEAVVIQEKIIAFLPGSTALSAANKAEVKYLGQQFTTSPEVRFRVDGHASYTGGGHNPGLTAELRVGKVQGLLMRGGISDPRIKTRTFAHSDPGNGHDEVVIVYGPGVE